MEQQFNYAHPDNAKIVQGVQLVPGQSAPTSSNPGSYGSGSDIMSKGGPVVSPSVSVPQGNLPAIPADLRPVE